LSLNILFAGFGFAYNGFGFFYFDSVSYYASKLSNILTKMLLLSLSLPAFKTLSISSSTLFNVNSA